ncbi:MAG: hypothetical protein KAT76_06780 [Bacteroidales bacterium]|nr:hypothetical protein [Bacteroidales bacterium]
MNQESENLSKGDEQGMNLSPYAMSNLRVAATWAKFLAIVGFVMIGIIVILGIIFLVGSADLSSGYYAPDPGFFISMGVVYLLIAVVFFFPTYYLLKFAGKMKLALNTRNELSLDDAAKFMRMYYKYVGILTIIIILIYVFYFIATLGS